MALENIKGAHEHTGKWISPNTLGGTEFRMCTVCKKFEVRDVTPPWMFRDALAEIDLECEDGCEFGD